MNKTMQGHWCGLVSVIADLGQNLKESGQVKNGPVHGPNRYKVRTIIWVWLRAGPQEQVLSSTNPGRDRAGLGPDAIQGK